MGSHTRIQRTPHWKISSSNPNLGHYPRNHTLEKRKTPLTTSPFLPTTVANSFKKQTNIGCIQALMGLIYHYWAELQNTYLRSLGTKNSGLIWIFALIRKLWNTAWVICNSRNHTVQATVWPQKNVNPISYQYKSLPTLRQRIPRNPQNMPVPIKKNPHSPLLTCPPETVMDISSLQCSPMLPENSQQDG